MFLTRLFIASDKTVRRLCRLLTATHEGFWLGVLRPSRFAEVAKIQYGQWARYQSDEHNKAGLFDWEEQAIAKWFPASGPLLLGACGGGRELLALAESLLADVARGVYECTRYNIPRTESRK